MSGRTTRAFCGECAGLLFPKEDKERRQLLYACRSCPYTEIATNPCVYAHDLIVTTRESAGVTTDITTDPTLAKTDIACPRPGCESTEAVAFDNQGKRTTTKMTLFYVCTRCSKTFQGELRIIVVADPSKILD